MGNEVSGVEKCIQWYSDIPNFADCNVLIVDMTTLDKRVLHNRTLDHCKELFEGIIARYKTGLHIYCIFTEYFEQENYEKDVLGNYFWCPIRFIFKKTKPGKTWRDMDDFGFPDYVKQISSWNLILEKNGTVPRRDLEFAWSYSEISMHTIISSNSDEIIGGIFGHSFDYAGRIFMFPPIDDTKLGIELILKGIGIKNQQKEIAPKWVKEISVPGIREIIQKIDEKCSSVEKIQIEITQLKEKQARLEKYIDLLYAEGDDLEEIVLQSFNELGFSNVRRGRNNKVEDVLFDLSTEYNIGVVEVKSSEKNMKLEHVRQTLHWALDYQENHKPKAILVSNIYRKDEFPNNRSQRESFKDFEDFCKKYDICIIPTTVIFDLICKKLEGKKINSEEFESLISKTSGTLTDVSSVIKK